MHRQSLCSPASKLHANGVVLIKEDISHISSPAELQKLSNSNSNGDEEDNKSQKKPAHKTSPPASRPENFIHLIPILALFCILILYLSSHDPSQTGVSDLAQFKGFKHLSKPIDSTNIDEIQRLLEVEKGEVLAIRSARNLQEVRRRNSKYRLNRKIGDF